MHGICFCAQKTCWRPMRWDAHSSSLSLYSMLKKDSENHDLILGGEESFYGEITSWFICENLIIFGDLTKSIHAPNKESMLLRTLI